MPAGSPARAFETACARGSWAEAEAIARGELTRRGGAQGWAGAALARCALARGDREEMRRWLDRAGRIISVTADLTDFLASMLLAAGDAKAALDRLDEAPDKEEDPAARLLGGTVRAVAWRLEGRLAEAAALAETLLRRHAVPPGAPLTGLADRLAADLGRPGWMACPGGRQLTGRLDPDLPGDTEIRLDGPAPQGWSAAGFRMLFGAPHFTLPLEGAGVSDGVAGAAGVWSLHAGGQPLLGSGLTLARRRVDGIAVVTGRRLTGWAASPDDPRPVRVLLTDQAGKTLDLATEADTDENGQPRFAFAADLGTSGLAPGRLIVTADGTALAGSPVAWRRRGADEIHPIRAVPKRRKKAVPAPEPTIDIVIPIHGNREVALACLDRVLATTRHEAAEIVVIDDCSPDPALAAALDRLAAGKRITLLRNPTNQGFPAAVNRGMALHKKRDVVLLNSDASVSGSWLRRLKRAAYAASDTGTVTALSNEASICSYGPDAPEAWPALDRLARRVNGGMTIELPTAVGFCMYIRRDCLAETGLFSETLFGRGYGEENDFCLRARRLGWRHVAAADLLVGHVGGASFGASRTLLLERNIRVLERLNPGYQKLVDRFAAADPLAPARRRLDLGRWRAADGRPALLLVTLDGDGGATRHVEERRRELAAQQCRVLLLAPGPARRQGRQKVARCRLEDPERPDLQDMLFDSDAEFETLAALLAAVPVASVEIHHSLGHHPRILDLPARLGVPHEVVLHDYHWLCPQVALIDATGRYCGEPQPSLPHCEACRLKLGSRSGEDITVEALRRRSGRLLGTARRVIAPARDVADRYRRYFPAIMPEIVPWDHVAPPAPIRHARAGGQLWGMPSSVMDPRLRGGDGERPAPVRHVRLAMPGGGMGGERADPVHHAPLAMPGGGMGGERADPVRHAPLAMPGGGMGGERADPVRHARAGGHPERAPGGGDGRRVRICVIGALGPHKGYDVLRACAEDAAARDLPLDFVVVGYSYDDAGLFATGRIHVTGRYEESEGPALVRTQNAAYAFIPSVFLETWCYALSVAWQAGLPAAAFDIGAPAERLRAAGAGGAVLPFDMPPSVINETLLALAAGFVVEGKIISTHPSAQEDSSMSQITATPQELILTPGFYAITVIRGGARPRPGHIALPAILVSTPPGEARAEILSSHAGGWLTREGDTVMLKISGDTPVLLTSYKDAQAPDDTLDIQFSRVDGQAPGVVSGVVPGVVTGVAPVPVAPPVALPAVEILAHVQRLGDQLYASGAWAGAPGKGVAIEGFTIASAGAEIEYKAVTAQGWETPWTPAGHYCGTRQQGLPLIGFAVRLIGQAAQRFDVQYEGSFISGGRSGPARNGAGCRSDVIGAPLEGILLSFSAKA